ARDKKPGKHGRTDRRGQVLFIDARELGYMIDRAERALSDEDIARIADAYHAWRGTDSAHRKGLTYEDMLGFCKSATLTEIKDADYALTPSRYIGAVNSEDDSEPLDEKIDRLSRELLEAFEESAHLEKVVREQLERIRA